MFLAKHGQGKLTVSEKMTVIKAHVTCCGAFTAKSGRVRAGRHQVGLDGMSCLNNNIPKHVGIALPKRDNLVFNFVVHAMPLSAKELAKAEMFTIIKVMGRLTMLHGKSSLGARDMLLDVIWHSQMFEHTCLVELSL